MKTRFSPIIIALSFCTIAHADWPQFQGPSRNGTSKESGLLRSFPKEGPRILWEKNLEQGFGGCAVAGKEA